MNEANRGYGHSSAPVEDFVPKLDAAPPRSNEPTPFYPPQPPFHTQPSFATQAPNTFGPQPSFFHAPTGAPQAQLVSHNLAIGQPPIPFEYAQQLASSFMAPGPAVHPSSPHFITAIDNLRADFANTTAGLAAAQEQMKANSSQVNSLCVRLDTLAPMEKRIDLLESKLQTVKEEVGSASALIDSLQHISSDAKLLGSTGTAIVERLGAFEKDLKSTLGGYDGLVHSKVEEMTNRLNTKWEALFKSSTEREERLLIRMNEFEKTFGHTAVNLSQQMESGMHQVTKQFTGAEARFRSALTHEIASMRTTVISDCYEGNLAVLKAFESGNHPDPSSSFENTAQKRQLQLAADGVAIWTYSADAIKEAPKSKDPLPQDTEDDSDNVLAEDEPIEALSDSDEKNSGDSSYKPETETESKVEEASSPEDGQGGSARSLQQLNKERKGKEDEKEEGELDEDEDEGRNRVAELSGSTQDRKKKRKRGAGAEEEEETEQLPYLRSRRNTVTQK
jgi:hypothetical protein